MAPVPAPPAATPPPTSPPPENPPSPPPAATENPGLIARLQAERDELKAKVGELIATKAHAIKEKVEAADPPGLADKVVGGIETALLKKVLIYAGLNGGPAAVVAAVAVWLARRGRKKLKAKRAAGISRPQKRDGHQVDQLEAAAGPRMPIMHTAKTVVVKLEGLLGDYPEDAAKDHARQLIAEGKNLFHEVFLSSLFREAVDKAERNDPEIKALGGHNVAAAIREWVRKEFLHLAGVRI